MAFSPVESSAVDTHGFVGVLPLALEQALVPAAVVPVARVHGMPLAHPFQIAIFPVTIVDLCVDSFIHVDDIYLFDICLAFI